MANTTTLYSDNQIMKALLTRDFSGIGGEFIDDVIASVKPGAFMEAKNLSKVSLPALKEVRVKAFTDAPITTLDIPWEQLEAIGFSAFMGASGLPENLVLTNATKISNGAFAGTANAKNTQLRTVSIPSWTGSSFSESGFYGSTIGIFAYCSAMTSFSAPELQSIPSYMLQGCAALTDIKFPKATSVSSSAFSSCTNLKKIELGGAISRFNGPFLSGCTALESLILSGVTTVPTITSTVLSNTNISKKTAYVYVPKTLEDTFKVASYWTNYASQIRAIEDYPDICG